MAERYLILGATSGMARAIARRLVQDGHKLILAGRSQDQLETMAQDLAVRGGQRPPVAPFDACDTDSHAAFVDQYMAGVDGVICAVGLLGDQELAQKDFNHFQAITQANYTGPASILSRVADRMEQDGKGVIVGISSVAGDRGRATNYVYGSAKAAFTSFLSGLRNRLAGKGVHVMTVKPGFVNTSMTEGMDLPGALTAEPEDVAERVVRAMYKKRNVIYVKPVWRLVMGIIIHIPEFIFKKMSL